MQTTIAVVGLVFSVAILIFLVMRTKVHAVVALVIAASIAGLCAGMEPTAVTKAITAGFGSTLSTIGLVIGFGVMMGAILETSGAAERLAISFVRLLGKKKEEWALAAAGFIVSIPIFVDSAFVILSPLVKQLAKTTGRSVLTLGIALAGGLIVTHHGVPPTPGPLGAAGIFGVSVGEMIFWGLIISIPAAIVITLWARYIGPRLDAEIQTSEDDDKDAKQAYAEFCKNAVERDKELPGLFISSAPIFIPIILIFLNTGISAWAKSFDVNATLVNVAGFIGNPVIALAIGLLIAVYGLTRGIPRDSSLTTMEKGVESAGIILLVTGAGGALGAVLRESGLGDTIGNWAATLPISEILIPFVIASLVRLIQGSGTVAIITAASISAPIISVLPDVHLGLAAQAACFGAMLFSYFNDSFFWVVNRFLGVKNARHQILCWSVPTTLAWGTSLVTLVVLDIFV